MHGMSKTPEFRAWVDLRQRCSNPHSSRYPNYGGRDISVCHRWSEFSNFFEDMGFRPSSEHSIDRIDNNGNYEPSNCRWATRSQQQQNKTRYTDAEKLPRGDGHWTRREPDRARRIARQNIMRAHKRGSANSNSRLTETAVVDVKRRIASGEPDTTIAAVYGVRPGTIWFIRTGRNWSHIQ